MKSFATNLKCVNCGQKFPIHKGPFICTDCGEEIAGPVRMIRGLIEVEYDYTGFAFDRSDFERRPDRTIWKFKELLPLKQEENIVSLGEGGTPLHHCRNLGRLWGVKNLFVKNEGMNPVGSFKDRETSVMISMAKELGVETVTIASSGNAGGAVAAYANLAQKKAVCFVPVSFSPMGKRSTYAAFKPWALIGVRGHYEDVNNLSIEMGLKYGWYHTNHGYNPYRIEGDKSIAYELCMDLGWRVPDRVINPVGSGGALSGEWKGFEEMHKFGWIDSLPKMTAIQVEAGAPLVDAILKDKPRVEPDLDAGDSIADGVISKYDDYAPLALTAIRKSGGTAAAVSDEETLNMELLLAREEGVFLEPSGAVALAGYKKLLDQGEIDPEELVVVVGTANGIKNPEIVLKDFSFPFELDFSEKAVSAVEQFLKLK